jgi:membrane carboxypeptidase/penicillin-binding protein
VALPIFIDFAQNALKDQPSLEFEVPPSITLIKTDPKTGKQDLHSPGAILEALKIHNVAEEDILDERDLFERLKHQDQNSAVDVY